MAHAERQMERTEKLWYGDFASLLEVTSRADVVNPLA